jgi:hypothetical protein
VDFIKQVFDNHKTSFTDGSKVEREVIKKDKIQAAMNELKVNSFDQSLEEIFKSIDVNHDGEVDFEEFKLFLQRPSRIDKWLRSLPIIQLIRSALEPVIDAIASNTPHDLKTDDKLQFVSKFSEDHIQLVLQGISVGLLKMLQESVQELNKSYEQLDSFKDRDANSSIVSKYTTPRTMNCGSVSDFYRGIGDRVGELLSDGMEIIRTFVFPFRVKWKYSFSTNMIFFCLLEFEFAS